MLPKLPLRKRDNRYFGNLGEDFAVKLLLKKGYKLHERNFKCKIGEIDAIFIDSDTLVFVEVKTRWSKKFGLPEEAVTPRKLYTIKRVGEYYLVIHPELPKKIKIEVVAIEIEDGKMTSAKIITVD